MKKQLILTGHCGTSCALQQGSRGLRCSIWLERLAATSSDTNRFSLCPTCERAKHLMACFSQQDGAPKASNNPTAPSASLRQPTHHRIDLKLFGGLETGSRNGGGGGKKGCPHLQKKRSFPHFFPTSDGEPQWDLCAGAEKTHQTWRGWLASGAPAEIRAEPIKSRYSKQEESRASPHTPPTPQSPHGFISNWAAASLCTAPGCTGRRLNAAFAR